MSSLIGIHQNGNGPAVDYVRAMKNRGLSFPVVKLVDDLSSLREIHEIAPETKIIVRFLNRWDSAQDIEKDGFPYLQAAQETIELIFSRTSAQERSWIYAFEIMNEADPPGVEGWRNFGKLLVQIVIEANKRGVRVVLPAFNAGTPEYGEMEALIESGVFRLMKETGHWLSVHEGVFGTDQPIDLWFGDHIPGFPFYLQHGGALCFRYRYLYQRLKELGQVVPLLISEMYFGGGRTNIEDGMARARWYETEASKDWFVMGILPFSIGGLAGADDYAYLYPRLIDYAEETKNRENGIPEMQDFPKTVKVRWALIGFNLRKTPDKSALSVAWARPDAVWTADREEGDFYHLAECNLWISKGAVMEESLAP